MAPGSMKSVLVNDMRVKSIAPANLHRVVYAFDMNKAAMDRLLSVLSQNWPDIQLDYRYCQAYFLVCMLDMVKRGELIIGADDSQQRKVMKRKMCEALIMCTRLVDGLLSAGIFDKWAKLLTYYGDYNGVRAIISLVVSAPQVSLKVRPDALLWYWSSLVIVMMKANKCDEALVALKKMRSSKNKANISHYTRMIGACSKVADISQRTRLIRELYKSLLADGVTPDTTIFNIMISLCDESEKQILLKEARKYNIELVR